MPSLKMICGVSSFAVALAVLPAATFGAGSDLSQQIQAATTKADYEALAAEYGQKAEGAKAQAALHQKMRDAYKGEGKAAGVSTMPQHCEGLIKSYEQQAKLYEEMAAASREQARKVK